MGSTQGPDRSGATTPLGHCNPSRPPTPPSELKNKGYPDYVDVTIVGAGASGLAITVQLIELIRNKQGKEIRSIALIEKMEDSVATGLAYSEASESKQALLQIYLNLSTHSTNPKETGANIFD